MEVGTYLEGNIVEARVWFYELLACLFDNVHILDKIHWLFLLF